VDPGNPLVTTLRRGHRAEHAAGFVPLIIVLAGAATFAGTVWWLVGLHRAALVRGSMPK